MMMKKIGFLFMATLALGSFSGCKKKGGDAMAKMGEFKDHMCACKEGDKDCAMKVQKEMADYAEANKDMKDQKMSDEDMKKATDIGMEMAKCSAKAMGAGAMGGGMAPPPPAGDKPAEGAAPAGDKPAGDKK
jgi:hypothetical protein